MDERGLVFFREWQTDREGRAAANFAVGGDVAFMILYDCLSDSQAKSVAIGGVFGSGMISSVEAIKNVREVHLFYALAVVYHLNTKVVIDSRRANGNGATARAIFYGVIEQDYQQFPYLRRVDTDRPVFEFEIEVDIAFFGLFLDLSVGLKDYLANICWLFVEMVLEAGDFQKTLA